MFVQGPGRSGLGRNGGPTVVAGGVPGGDGLRSGPGLALGGRGWRPAHLGSVSCSVDQSLASWTPCPWSPGQMCVPRKQRVFLPLF